MMPPTSVQLPLSLYQVGLVLKMAREGNALRLPKSNSLASNL